MTGPDLRSAVVAREYLIRAVLRRVSAEREEPHSSYEAEMEYCDDMILSFARDLVNAVGEER